MYLPGLVSLRSYRSSLTAFVRNLPTHASIAIGCICFLSALLVACGGSSGSGAVSDSQATTPVDGNITEAPPPDTQSPGTGDYASYNPGDTLQAVIDQSMSDVDKKMLTHVNNARSQARSCGNVNYPATNTLSWHCTHG